ncbi:PIN domain-containing protein [Sphingomonas sp. SUN039]|uniref:PIN domain-containing protein n=1 Tax=Sphingomonas sp. SUN039 TaxID=2937787 RepID=UPI0021641D4A|nr:PIN domain-containing protein [Sphingomonas sp. SUN039]UVO54320.1 PIN domain-containing protein [Sphingomonas sp. SUN039]
MRVVVDSNVLLSALISRRSAPYAVYQEWLSGRFELLTSEMQIEEIRRVSRYARMREAVHFR